MTLKKKVTKKPQKIKRDILEYDNEHNRRFDLSWKIYRISLFSLVSGLLFSTHFKLTFKVNGYSTGKDTKRTML